MKCLLESFRAFLIVFNPLSSTPLCLSGFLVVGFDSVFACSEVADCDLVDAALHFTREFSSPDEFLKRFLVH